VSMSDQESMLIEASKQVIVHKSVDALVHAAIYEATRWIK